MNDDHQMLQLWSKGQNETKGVHLLPFLSQGSRHVGRGEAGGGEVNVDGLTGKKLGVAVAEEVMEWTQVYQDTTFDQQAKLLDDGITFSIWTMEDHDENFIQYGPLIIGERDHTVISGRGWSERYWAPWCSMGDAWEVDKEDWLWRFKEHQMGIDVLLDDVNTGKRVSATAEWGDFPTKGIMYCHIRLRAALKAARGGEG